MSFCLIPAPTHVAAKQLPHVDVASGDETIEQRSPMMGTRRSVSMQHHARPLMTTDELMDLPADEEIVRIGGVKPILAKKCDYRVDRNFRARLLPVPERR